MNTIKFLPNNYIKLTTNNKTIILNKINKVKYYDKASKCYRHLPITYKIKNNYYA